MHFLKHKFTFFNGFHSANLTIPLDYKLCYIYGMKRWLPIFMISVFSMLFLNCADKKSDYIDPRGPEFAGSESCIQCHKSASENAMHSAHFKATAPATAESILGNFNSPHNVFDYGNNSKMVMEKRGDSLYQVFYKGGKEIKAYPFDIVFGNRNAQTAVYWKHKNTYELPISYYKAENTWGTSPGFSPTQPYFDRMTIKDCYACHSSNASANKVNSGKNNFLAMEVEDNIAPESLVYGIDCERCHRAGEKTRRLPTRKSERQNRSFYDGLQIAQQQTAA
ncbi:hypothetical protein [Flavobacterium sp. 3HN19-14]|uniref:hypothetical protein n=1 Tax=Flavobacterium sp. 3HN19-14 TaxID=3448133 RepID=UPI003EE03BAB